MAKLRVAMAVAVALAAMLMGVAQGQCSRVCDLALGSYYVSPNYNLSYILNFFNSVASQDIIVKYNSLSNADVIIAGSRIRIPFSCDCLSLDDGSTYLGHRFQYTLKGSDTYEKIANYYANLTSVAWLRQTNPSYNELNLPEGGPVNVTVNCSCGDSAVSNLYGLFLTYPLRTTDNLTSLEKESQINSTFLLAYNKNVNFSQGQGIVFIPDKDLNGSYHPLATSGGGEKFGNNFLALETGIGAGAIAGISVGIVAALAFVAIGLFYFHKSKTKKSSLLQSTNKYDSTFNKGGMNHYAGNVESIALTGSASQGLADITVDKSVEFSYQELAEATNGFSIANKIGEGGFGAVYYAELRGEKAAIKKMDMQATKEFLAELKVLTHVHHLNLVRLIGYCTEESLFLVYEFIENGNLSQHLRGSAMEPLSWPSRVQIALDSARGLEYIHEHTVPVYIHRDIKSANILIDKNYRSKVADFGLTKLTEVGGASSTLPTRLVGTFGYMPPEYAQFGDVSPKVDVYAFGVVLYEIISAKEAIVKIDDVSAETKGLVTVFESILNDPSGHDRLPSLIDPRLGQNYPLESARKMAQLARACTQENPQLRPSMRTVVVALMTLSSATEDWDVGTVYENQALVNLMSGR
ncbi:chitin elicitor receptor kinase 1 [Cryptomeria japonica]|uniref:chitin elicitor receptor kinase 1 n=1 Tax=Cryptomeria japonica TaxID=3369 RepID=UPI0025ACA873|nr:chitin elicitor receptor kinase 1 [Cryptomeria japonica]